MLEPMLLVLLLDCAASYSAARRDMMAVLSTTTSPSIFTTGTCHGGRIHISACHSWASMVTNGNFPSNHAILSCPFCVEVSAVTSQRQQCNERILHVLPPEPC